MYSRDLVILEREHYAAFLSYSTRSMSSSLVLLVFTSELAINLPPTTTSSLPGLKKVGSTSRDYNPFPHQRARASSLSELQGRTFESSKQFSQQK
jgi:hypothetical protein